MVLQDFQSGVAVVLGLIEPEGMCLSAGRGCSLMDDHDEVISDRLLAMVVVD